MDFKRSKILGCLGAILSLSVVFVMAGQSEMDEQLNYDLQVVRDLDVELLRKTAVHLKQLHPVPLKPEQLFAAVAEVTERLDVADVFVRLALTLYGRVRQAGCGLSDVLDELSSAIEQNPDWSVEEIERWKAIDSVFRELIGAPVVRLVTTAIDLSYEHANLLLNARILTDIRPLYSLDATVIEGAVVSHTLRLRYETIDGAKELTISLDETDVEKLVEQCERAQTKSKTARELMQSKADVPTIVSGGNDDA